MSEEDRGMTVREAGALGGKKRRAELGPEGYAAMGRKGGATTKARHGTAHYERIGKQGGSKLRDERGLEHFREIGRKGGQRVKGLVAEARQAELLAHVKGLKERAVEGEEESGE